MSDTVWYFNHLHRNTISCACVSHLSWDLGHDKNKPPGDSLNIKSSDGILCLQLQMFRTVHILDLLMGLKATSSTWTCAEKFPPESVAMTNLYHPARWRRLEPWRRWLENIRTRHYGNVWTVFFHFNIWGINPAARAEINSQSIVLPKCTDWYLQHLTDVLSDCEDVSSIVIQYAAIGHGWEPIAKTNLWQLGKKSTVKYKACVYVLVS